MAKSRRIRSRTNTNASTISSRVENIKNALTTNGIGHCDEHGSITSSNSETIEYHENVTNNDAKIYSQLVAQLIVSRLLLFATQCVLGLLPDAATDAFKVKESEDYMHSRFVRPMFGGLTRWDGMHYLHIAEHGYTWESTLAFFPLFPMILRFLGTLISTGISSLSFYSAMVVGGVLFNNTIFVLNGLLLYQLCLKLTKSEKDSILAVYVYCFNPSSVFFSAVYSESLFMLFTLLGLKCLYNDKKTSYDYVFDLLMASVAFALSFFTRSNGWLNFGYVGYQIMLSLLTNNGKWERKRRVFVKGIKYFPLLLICFVIVIAPLRSFSATQEERFCRSTTIFAFDETEEPYSNPFHDEYMSGRVLPGDIPKLKWCHKRNDLSILPVYYSSLQRSYWDVGFLQYWQLKKIPMFIMALPTLTILLYGVADIVLDITLDSRNGAVILHENNYLIPFAIHSTVLGLGAVFFYNVEVVTRILFSTSPFMYITIARIMSQHCPRIKCPDDLMEPPVFPFFANYFFVRTTSKVLIIYLLGYCFFGTVAFVNWLPYC
ncbi:unnamed protein product [Bursaphelenchus okinawaensis]|uniref:GPI mannosyltransferase 2 n=1 Tax=Bursaphelenchus okinawaensis TaxID=465554 RepID=A0A811JW50_9BILA|nr:unnamed protein product [Bursaphelenchus okinawaensis]CAG9086550.1 unnamed protein product [Bursaphelenchus okinawaensis]